MTQIALSGVGVEFGATKLFSGITFTVASGERWGIVGRNGTGKTTLFKVITGEQSTTHGAVARQPGLRVSLLEQHRDFGEGQSVWEATAGPFAELLRLEQSLTDQAAALGADTPAAALDRYGRDLERFEREGGYTIAPRVDAILHGLGFDPVLARATPLSQLSGGERGRIGLARQLVGAADILLLDEPTNHLDLDTTRWLEQYLHDVGKTVLIVSHDRAFLSSVADHILHFEGGTALAYAGGYESFVAQRAERRLAQSRAFEKQRRAIAHEEDYIARNIAGQNSRQAKGRRKRLERLPRLGALNGDEDTMALRFEPHERGGDRVISADHATVAVGDRVLVQDFSGTLKRGEVLGLIGPNGAGKSTLLKALVGELPLAGGDLRLGASIDAAIYRQDLSQVPLHTTLYGAVEELRPRWERRQVQGHLGRFGFSGDEVQRSVATLSGGERARLGLALLVLSRGNLLILDEPTNHLDVESIEALEDAIDAYEGTVVLVSHDRTLLRELATEIWVLRDARLTVFPGTFAEWEVASAEREHAASVRAAEEESLRRVRERRNTGRPAARKDEDRKVHERARAALDEVEGRIAELETRIGALTAALEDPALYVRSDGVAEATRMGSDLEKAKRMMDAALEQWAAASDTVAQLAGPKRDR